MLKKLLRIEEITFGLYEDESLLPTKIISILGIEKKQLLSFEVVKKSVDSRNKSNILIVYGVNVDIGDNETFFHKKPYAKLLESIKRHKIRLIDPFCYEIKKINTVKISSRPIVVGTGPSGLFCALVLAYAGMNPIVLEQGSCIEKRVNDVNTFFHTGELDLHSNVQFGEGGAGTFSDGKLYTLVNDPRSKFIFEQFVSAGAPKEILYSAHPHIGTDKLREVVVNIRKTIIQLGGEIKFDTIMSDLKIENGKIQSVITNRGEKFSTDTLIFGIGHSARETYEMLYQKGFQMTQKAFSMGVRIEHPRESINKAQFGERSYHHPKLGSASYKLVSHHEKNRCVYSFCMCPGGHIIPASSEVGKLTLNGMSEYAQDGLFSNSALLVSVLPSDFGSDHPLAGIDFQRKWEQIAFENGGGNHHAPAQFVGDFLSSQSSKGRKVPTTSYRPNITLTNLDNCLPIFITDALKEALPVFEKKIHGFADPNALILGIEARTSSVVRFQRSQSGESNILGVYPIGEGAGYAGGITSSALDGLTIAENIINKYAIV